MITANDPNRRSWVDVPAGSDFPIQNLPFGIFKPNNKEARIGVAIGDYVADLAFLNTMEFFADLEIPNHVFQNQYPQ